MRLALLAVLLFVPPQESDVVAVKAERIITVSGAEIRDGVVLIEKGRIKAVGKDVTIPEGAVVHEAKVVMPGIVDAGSSYGLSGRQNEEVSEITPDFRVVDNLNPARSDLKRAIQSGVTTIYVGPGNRNVIGGMGSVIRTSDKTSSLVIREDVSLKATMGSAPSRGNYPPRGSSATFYARRPTTRMGVVWLFRKAFFDAQKYKEERSREKDAGMEILAQALQKNIPVRIWANRASDIETTLRLCDEFGLKPILEEAQEAYKFAKELNSRGIPVILRPQYSTNSIYGQEGTKVRFNTFEKLIQAGVKVALLPESQDPRESHLAMAAFTVRCGGKPADVIRALTLSPAEILGVSKKVGSIDTGKDGNLLLLSGDPLDVKTRIEAVLLEGKRIHKYDDK